MQRDRIFDKKKKLRKKASQLYLPHVPVGTIYIHPPCGGGKYVLARSTPSAAATATPPAQVLRQAAGALGMENI